MSGKFATPATHGNRLTAAVTEAEKSRAAHLASYRFQPGQSGNPGGRTVQLAECQAIARKASPRAIERLVELVESEDERVALMAADKVLERAWGKPKLQAADADPFAGMSREERNRRTMELLAFAATLQVPPDAAAEIERDNAITIDSEDGK